MKYFLIFLILSIGGCTKLKQEKLQDTVSIKLLNEQINIPSNDQDSCSDMIVFQISNDSDYEYLFDIADTTGFFFLSKSPLKDEFIDPFGGFGIGFIDEKGEYLECDGYSGFNPEGFENIIIEKKLYKLLPQKSIIFKVPLTFPSKLDFGSYIQKVTNIDRATKVEVFFRPGNGYLKNTLLKSNGFKLKGNQRIMDVSKRFFVPVVFDDCSKRP